MFTMLKQTMACTRNIKKKHARADLNRVFYISFTECQKKNKYYEIKNNN